MDRLRGYPQSRQIDVGCPLDTHPLEATLDKTGTIEGLTSGRIWVRSQNVSTLVERSTGDGGMLHFTFKGDWVSENAPDLKVDEILHASWNASGELTVEQYRFNCRMARN